MDNSNIIIALYICIGIVSVIALGLFAFYFWIDRKKSETKSDYIKVDSQDGENNGKDKVQNFGRFQGELTRESIHDFMEFDEVKDGMIIRKNRNQYVMILQCNGVNYDLMSETEKLAVEEGFVQFLNILRFPIQLYVQSRTLNLKEILEEYTSRIHTLENDIQKLDVKILEAKAKGNNVLKEKYEFEKRRKRNVLEYGLDITEYVGRMSSNRNILQQKTYVIVSYYVAEIGTSIDNYSKDEIDSMCFTELYTRCQNVASALANSQVSSSILDSEEISELLYIAYNRDESELLQFTRALDSQYDSLYATSKDVYEKKKEMLDIQINEQAIEIASDSLIKADRMRQEEKWAESEKRQQKEKVKEKAKELLKQYEDRLDDRVFELAIENIDKLAEEKFAEKKVTKKVNKETETKSKATTATTAKTKKIIRKK